MKDRQTEREKGWGGGRVGEKKKREGVMGTKTGGFILSVDAKLHFCIYLYLFIYLLFKRKIQVSNLHKRSSTIGKQNKIKKDFFFFFGDRIFRPLVTCQFK